VEDAFSNAGDVRRRKGAYFSEEEAEDILDTMIMI
jgi:hypothetical protein